MSSEDHNEITIPVEVAEAIKVLIGLTTLNFSNITDEKEYKSAQELVIDDVFVSGLQPILRSNNLFISGHDLFNGALILITEILAVASNHDEDKVHAWLKELGLLVVNS